MTKRDFVESTPLFASLWIEGNAKKGEALEKLMDEASNRTVSSLAIAPHPTVSRVALDFEGQIIVCSVACGRTQRPIMRCG
uniref:Uncharacterized protein n=1 Tax=Plectus sambesii TaxID=2011161 RepID=A0A914WHD1_9BILA